jgi:mono/diheme cytochrome c family protein
MRAYMRRTCLLIAIAFGFGTSSALAADADHGADLAKRWCASCHVVANGQATARGSPSSFSTRIRRCPTFP